MADKQKVTKAASHAHTTSTSHSPVATTAASAASAFVPMRSLLFNPSDGHVYLPKSYTRNNADNLRDPETDLIIQEDIPAHEWEPGKRLDPYTFLLDGKEYEAGFVPDLNPSKYEHVEGFPTPETTDAILRLVQRTFPGLDFSIEIDERTKRTYIVAGNSVIPRNSEKFMPGAVAIQAMTQNEKVALDWLGNSLRASAVLR